MKFSMMLQAVYDYWHGRGYGLKEYVLRDGKKHPFALICPGGAYSMVVSFIEGAPYAKKLNKMGYSAFVLYYRCGRHAHFPAPQEDLRRALKDILNRAEELNLETTGYSVWGSSAGGHLAATFGTQKLGYASANLPKPAALILTYPVITMENFSHAGSRENLLSKHPTQAEIDLYSVEKNITADYPPTFIWCGDADQTVDPKNSRVLAEELRQQDVPCEFVTYPGVGHGVGLGEGLACEGWFDRAVAFWERQRGYKQ